MSDRKRRSGKNRLAEIQKPRGFERALEFEEIVGVTNYTGDLMFLIRWHNCNELDLLSASEVNEKIPNEVISFYEKRCQLNKKAKDRAKTNIPIAAREPVKVKEQKPDVDDAAEASSDAPEVLSEPAAMDVDEPEAQVPAESAET